MEISKDLTKTRNSAIDIFRLFGAVCIVALHTFLFIDVNTAFYDLVINFIMSRYVVQFFICITGYYFCKGMISLKPQFFNMLKIYIFWSLIYYAASFVKVVIMEKTPLSRFLVDRLVFFFTQGSYPHMWNIIAVLYAMLIIWATFKFLKTKGLNVLSLVSILLFCIGVISEASAIKNIFFIGLPFMCLGYLIAKFEAVFRKLSSGKIVFILSVIAVVYIVENIFSIFVLNAVDRPNSQFSTYLLVGVLCITLLRFPAPRFSRFAKTARGMSSFIYFSHPLIIVVFSDVLRLKIDSIVLFFMVLTTSAVLGYISVKLRAKGDGYGKTQ